MTAIFTIWWPFYHLTTKWPFDRSTPLLTSQWSFYHLTTILPSKVSLPVLIIIRWPLYHPMIIYPLHFSRALLRCGVGRHLFGSVQVTCFSSLWTQWPNRVYWLLSWRSSSLGGESLCGHQSKTKTTTASIDCGHCQRGTDVGSAAGLPLSSLCSSSSASCGHQKSSAFETDIAWTSWWLVDAMLIVHVNAWTAVAMAVEHRGGVDVQLGYRVTLKTRLEFE